MFKDCSSIILKQLQEFLIAALFYLFSFSLSQPIYSAYFIFFLPYLVQLLSFLYPLLISPSFILLLLSLLVISPHDLNQTQFRLGDIDPDFHVLETRVNLSEAVAVPMHGCCQELEHWFRHNLWGDEQEMLCLVPDQDLGFKIGEDQIGVSQGDLKLREVDNDEQLMIRDQKINGIDHLQMGELGATEHHEQLKTLPNSRIGKEPIRLNQAKYEFAEADDDQEQVIQGQKTNGDDHRQKNELGTNEHQEQFNALLDNGIGEDATVLYQVNGELVEKEEDQELVIETQKIGADHIKNDGLGANEHQEQLETPFNNRIGEGLIRIYEVNAEFVEADKHEQVMIRGQKINGVDRLQMDVLEEKEHQEQLKTLLNSRIGEDPLRLSEENYELIEADEDQELVNQSQKTNGVDDRQKDELRTNDHQEQLNTLLDNGIEEDVIRLYQVNEELVEEEEGRELVIESQKVNGDDHLQNDELEANEHHEHLGTPLNSRTGEGLVRIYEVNDHLEEADEAQEQVIQSQTINGVDHLQNDQLGKNEHHGRLKTLLNSRAGAEPIRLYRMEEDKDQEQTIQSGKVNGVHHLQNDVLGANKHQEQIKTLPNSRIREDPIRFCQVTDELVEEEGEDQETVIQSPKSNGADHLQEDESGENELQKELKTNDELMEVNEDQEQMIPGQNGNGGDCLQKDESGANWQQEELKTSPNSSVEGDPVRVCQFDLELGANEDQHLLDSSHESFGENAAGSARLQKNELGGNEHQGLLKDYQKSRTGADSTSGRQVNHGSMGAEEDMELMFSTHGSFGGSTNGIDHPQKDELKANEHQIELTPSSSGCFTDVSGRLSTESWVAEDRLLFQAMDTNRKLMSHGSKKKEWRRTLACKLYEERQREFYEGMEKEKGWSHEGMDVLWEVYEADSRKDKEKVREATPKTKRGMDDDEEDEIGMDSQLCCLQAIRYSTSRMSFGFGRLQSVKISKAFKGMGLFLRKERKAF